MVETINLHSYLSDMDGEEAIQIKTPDGHPAYGQAQGAIFGQASDATLSLTFYGSDLVRSAERTKVPR
jgi:hypothetical protein